MVNTFLICSYFDKTKKNKHFSDQFLQIYFNIYYVLTIDLICDVKPRLGQTNFNVNIYFQTSDLF